MNVLYFAAGLLGGVMLVAGLTIDPRYFVMVVPAALCLVVATAIEVNR